MEGAKMVPSSLGTSQGLISRLQSREFCTAEESKMLFTLFKGCKRIKIQRRIWNGDHD